MRPEYMTTTSSASSATTPRSCVIRMMAVPVSWRSVRIRSSTWAWMVTSSAVVGSSAISNWGSHASAMAIITRWRMPPDSLCGYSSMRRSGEGMRTRRSISIACARAASALTSRCARMPSISWSPMVKAGLSEVIGSWKIIAMRLPRRARISSGVSVARSLPSKRTVPALMRPWPLGSRPMMDSEVTLLPQPDSPTMPSVRPAATEKLTPSTAANSPPSSSRKLVRKAAHFEQRGHRALPPRRAWKRSISASITARSVMPAGRWRDGRQAVKGW